MDGKPKDGKDVADAKANPVHMDDVLIEIGGKNTVAEFTQNLTGASSGEERTFDVSYPEDATDKRLAGKTFVYTVKVNGIKQKSLPELNDDFAKELGEFTSLDQVRKQIRENMEAEKRHTAEHAAKDKLVADLVKRNDFEVPESLVDRQIDLRLERGLRALAAQGMKMEDLKKMDLAAPSGRAARAGSPRCEVFVAAGANRGSGENRGQRRGSEPGGGSSGETVKTNLRSSSRSFDRGWGPR